MININDEILKLKKISSFYEGLDEQKELFESILCNLRNLYKNNKNSFSASNINEINQAKSDFNESKWYIQTYGRIDRAQIPNALYPNTVVLHKAEYYVGVVQFAVKSASGMLFRIKYSNNCSELVNPDHLKIIGTFIKDTYYYEKKSSPLESNEPTIYATKPTRPRYIINPDGTVENIDFE